MAELPTAKERTLNLIQPIRPGAGGPASGNQEIDTPRFVADATVNSPEESLAKFKELGEKAKKGGKLPLDATKIADALQKLTVPHAGTVSLSVATIGRSLQIPKPIHEAIISILDAKSDVPGFVRDAIKSVAQSRVIPKTIIDQASEVGRARKASKGRCQVTVNMEESLYAVVDTLARRTKLSDKAVMEACTVLYLQAVMASR